MNNLQRLASLGHSVWYDYIRRDLYTKGTLAGWIENDDLRGMTSNPSIFQKAIAGSELYDDDIRRHAGSGKKAKAIFEALAVEDIQACADLFRPVWEKTDCEDGYVSIEVDPHLAHETDKTLAEAKRLFEVCDRPNVMVKIPGTRAGLPAIRGALAAGIPINVTLLFSVERYGDVIDAYLSGMEDLLVAKGDPTKVRSVASFFVSRVDARVDFALDSIASDNERPARERETAKELRGEIAIANARAAWRLFEERFASPRYRSLASKGVALQRPLWASTSTKDPEYPDLYYVEALIGPNSVDTMPPDTYEAFRAHGKAEVRIDERAEDLDPTFKSLQGLGVDLPGILDELESEGVAKFAESYDDLLSAVDMKARAIRTG
jgi:transaldolase